MTVAASSSYEVGDNVRCEWHGSWYDAKIMRVDPTREEGTQYLVHYAGWKARHDAWVDAGSASRWI